MSYKDPEKQRAFQRKWAKAKKEREGKTKEPALTVADLLAFDIKKRGFSGYVGAARQFFPGRFRTIDRMHIAALTERVCQIEHGGDRRGGKWKEEGREMLTLRRFADQIDCHPKTLHEWLSTYRFFVSLPPQTPADYRAARMTMEAWPAPADPAATYLAMLQRKSREWKEWTIMARLRAAVSACKKHGIDCVSKENEEEMFKMMGELSSILLLQRKKNEGEKNSGVRKGRGAAKLNGREKASAQSHRVLSLPAPRHGK